MQQKQLLKLSSNDASRVPSVAHFNVDFVDSTQGYVY